MTLSAAQARAKRTLTFKTPRKVNILDLELRFDWEGYQSKTYPYERAFLTYPYGTVWIQWSWIYWFEARSRVSRERVGGCLVVGWGAMVANGWLEGIWTCVSRRLGQSYIDRSFGIAFIVYILNDDIILMIACYIWQSFQIFRFRTISKNDIANYQIYHLFINNIIEIHFFKRLVDLSHIYIWRWFTIEYHNLIICKR